MNKSMRPAIIGGVVLGLLSAIPFVNFVNLCCCAWAILGGLLAANLYIKESPVPVTPGEGAKIGAIAGVIGAVIYLVIGVPIGVLAGEAIGAAIISIFGSFLPPEQTEQLRDQFAMAKAAQGGFAAQLAGAFVQGIIGAILLTIFATVGGLLGVQLLEKRKGGPAGAPPPPPPPPTFGGAGS